MARKPPDIELTFPISLALFRRIDKAVRRAGYGAAIDWSESISPPISAKHFASEAIYVICNSGMRNSVAVPIFEKCMVALSQGQSVKMVYGHPGKSEATDWIWCKRGFALPQTAPDQRSD